MVCSMRAAPIPVSCASSVRAHLQQPSNTLLYYPTEDREKKSLFVQLKLVLWNRFLRWHTTSTGSLDENTSDNVHVYIWLRLQTHIFTHMHSARVNKTTRRRNKTISWGEKQVAQRTDCTVPLCVWFFFSLVSLSNFKNVLLDAAFE